MDVAAQRRIVGTASGLLVVAIGVLGILHGTSDDPKQVQAELQARIDELHRIPDGDSARKEALAREILADESYRQHARALRLKVEREHPRLCEQANLDREAQKVVPPFLARCKDLGGLARHDLTLLTDEARAQLGNYQRSRYGPALRDALRRLEETTPQPSPEYLPMLAKVHDGIKQGKFSEASQAAQTRELREMVERQAEAAAKKLVAEAKSAKEIEEAMPRFKGTRACERLERARKDLTKP